MYVPQNTVEQILEEWLSIANWLFSLYVMKYTGCSSYIHWSTKICELGHAPLATEYACFLRVIRHEDAALKCIAWLIVMKYSTMTNFKTPITVASYSTWNHIHIRADSMTYLTGRIVTCIEKYTFSCQKQIHDRKPFCDFEVYLWFPCDYHNWYYKPARTLLRTI